MRVNHLNVFGNNLHIGSENQVNNYASLASLFSHHALYQFLNKLRGQDAANAVVVEQQRGWVWAMLLPTDVKH
jgi:hypothetical protein